MTSSFEYITVTTATDDKQIAQRIAHQLIETQLAACVQTHQVASFYRWQGKFCEAPEFSLNIKTRRNLYVEVEKLIRSLHNYSLPQIIAVPIVAGSADYLQWISENCGVCS